MKAIIIQPDGEKEVRELEKRLTLEELQGLVGGFIQYAPQNALMEWRGENLIVNEEGLVHELEYNAVASMMAGCILVGVAVLIDYPDKDEDA